MGNSQDAASSTSLAAFLKSLRRRVDRRAQYLGDYRRLETRLGRIVSQEEIAEALDVSRCWYCLLESGRSPRASTRLLARIADTLMLSTGERAELFRLAVPEVTLAEKHEVRTTELKPAAYEMLAAYRSLRDLGRDMWSASTPSEILDIVREYGAKHFVADSFSTEVRYGANAWGDMLAIGMPHFMQRYDDLDEFLLCNCGPSSRDQLRFYDTLLVAPGDVMRLDDVPESMNFLEKFGAAFVSVGWTEVDILAGAVRSKAGFEAVICALDEKRRGFTELEREHMSTVAQLASHAL